VGQKSHYRYKGVLRKMLRYRVIRNQIVTTIIHIESYLTILGLIEQELANSDITLERLIQLKRAHLEFQRLFYSGNSNRSGAVQRTD